MYTHGGGIVARASDNPTSCSACQQELGARGESVEPPCTCGGSRKWVGVRCSCVVRRLGCFLSPFDASRPLHFFCKYFRLKGGYRFSSLPIPWVRYAHVESRETVVHCKRRPWARVTRRVGQCFLATANALDLEPSLVAIDVFMLVEEGHSFSGGCLECGRCRAASEGHG